MKRITGNKSKVNKSKMNKLKLDKSNNKPKKKPNVKIIIVGIILIIIFAFVVIRVLPTIRKIEVTIDVSGNEENGEVRITKDQVLSLAQIKVGDKLYKDLRSQIESRIEENPYVENATVERSLSGTVKINVTQREAVYMINYAGEYIYIDREGYILEVNPNSNGGAVIIGLNTDVSGLSMGNSKIRLNQDDLEKLDSINTIVATLRSNGIENTITQIDISEKKDIILNLEYDGKQVYIGDSSDMNTKALYIKKILETESGHNRNYIY